MESNDQEKLKNNRLLKYVLGYGILGTVTYVVLFFTMKWFELVYLTELRTLNFVFLSAIVYYAIKNFKSQKDVRMDYVTGLGLGFFVSLVSFGLFSTFMFVYLQFINPSFMEYLVRNAPFGSYLDPLSIVVILLFEGAAVGAILSLIFMQYFKVEDETGDINNRKPQKEVQEKETEQVI